MLELLAILWDIGKCKDVNFAPVPLNSNELMVDESPELGASSMDKEKER